MNTEIIADFAFKFQIVNDSEFDRVAVFDGYKIHTENSDPENYKNFNIDETEFIYSVITKYNLKIKIGTAYKYKSQQTRQVSIIIWFTYLIFCLLMLLIIFSIYKTQKLNNKLKESNKIIETYNCELQRLSIVASKTDNYVIMVSEKDEIEWINNGFTKITGFTSNEAIGKPPSKVIGGEDTELRVIQQIDNAIFINKKSFKGEITNYKKDGSKFKAAIDITPIFNEQEEFKGYFVIGRDISEKQKYQEQIKIQRDIAIRQKNELSILVKQLKHNEKTITRKNIELLKLSHVVSNTDSAIMIIDKNGKIEWVNNGFTKLYGFTFEEFTSIHDNIFKSNTNLTANRFIRDAIKNKETVTYKLELLHKNNSKLWIQTTWTPVLDKSGDLLNLIAIDTDITDLKKAETKIITQNQSIKDSINYASNIQKALLPSEKDIQEIFPEHFIFYKPRDVVSGDFYWVQKINSYIIIAVADCTGHGVPGALMSMLGIAFLTNIIQKKHITKANQALEELRKLVKKSLHQTNNTNQTRDGMDIALYVIDKRNNKLQYSGAFNPLYIIRKEETTQQLETNKLTILKADQQPIAIHLKEKNLQIRPFNYKKMIVYTLSPMVIL